MVPFSIIMVVYFSITIYNLQENRLIERYVNHYSKPKYKYGNTLVNNEVTPFSLIREHNLNKTMIVTNASYDLTNNRVEIESEQL